jgi:hypothetical protein
VAYRLDSQNRHHAIGLMLAYDGEPERRQRDRRSGTKKAGKVLGPQDIGDQGEDRGCRDLARTEAPRLLLPAEASAVIGD